jgi:hypothetical protein
MRRFKKRHYLIVDNGVVKRSDNMVKAIIWVLLGGVFILGFLLGSMPIFTSVNAEKINASASNAVERAQSFFAGPPTDVPSPKDRISESDIQVLDDKVVINIQNPQWSRFLNTKSMDPVIDAGANAIQVAPNSSEDIQVGDIISYNSSMGTIIHRVIETGNDSDGWYAIVKGDNNPTADPSKVRFDQVKRVLVAIIY